jgi:hypothetical protein
MEVRRKYFIKSGCVKIYALIENQKHMHIFSTNIC